MFRSALLLLAAIGLLTASCSTGGLGKMRLSGNYTKADLATLSLRDLNPLARHVSVVPVHQSTMQAISEERMAQLRERRGFLWFRKPVDWTPPSLPEGALAANGSLLPPRTGGSLAVLNVGDYLADPEVAAANPRLTAEGRQDFSIE